MIKIIESIIDDFAKQGFVFSNEQDFQFQMALALKASNLFKDIKLEAISLEDNWTKVENLVKTNGKISRQKKQYHDILVKLSEEEYVLIELKYKTPNKLCLYETVQGKTIMFVQGDYNIGAYDFIEDISRLERISKRHMPGEIQKYIKKSYAIILTNDKNYRYNDFKNSLWKNYSIVDNKKFNKDKIKFLINGQAVSQYQKGRNFVEIDLINDYPKFKWEDYKLCDLNGVPYNNYKDEKVNKKIYTCPGFSYLIVEVPPQNQSAKVAPQPLSDTL